MTVALSLGTNTITHAHHKSSTSMLANQIGDASNAGHTETLRAINEPFRSAKIGNYAPSVS